MSSAARRSLFTAALAGALLLALWFVPTVHLRSVEAASSAGSGTSTANDVHTDGYRGVHPAAGTAAADHRAAVRLARTGTDTGPGSPAVYVSGATLVVLGLGAGFVTYSMRGGRAGRS